MVHVAGWDALVRLVVGAMQDPEPTLRATVCVAVVFRR